MVEELGGEFGRFELVEGFGLDTGTCQRAATPRGALRVQFGIRDLGWGQIRSSIRLIGLFPQRLSTCGLMML